jgi:hypothetical protein
VNGQRSIAPGRIVAPMGATATIFLALLFDRGDVLWIPGVSELVGLAAVMLAPGIAAEPALRGRRWTLLERFGYAAVLSAAIVALAGLGLHIAALPVTTTNVLSILLGVAAVLGIASLPYRRAGAAVRFSASRAIEIYVAFASLFLLSGAIAAILLLRPAPDPPNLEVALVDDAGMLLAQPIQTRPDAGVRVNLMVRTRSRPLEPAWISVSGQGVRPWSTRAVLAPQSWSVVVVSLMPNTVGIVSARIDVRNAQAELTLPIQLDVRSR